MSEFRGHRCVRARHRPTDRRRSGHDLPLPQLGSAHVDAHRPAGGRGARRGVAHLRPASPVRPSGETRMARRAGTVRPPCGWRSPSCGCRRHTESVRRSRLPPSAARPRRTRPQWMSGTRAARRTRVAGTPGSPLRTIRIWFSGRVGLLPTVVERHDRLPPRGASSPSTHSAAAMFTVWPGSRASRHQPRSTPRLSPCTLR